MTGARGLGSRGRRTMARGSGTISIGAWCAIPLLLALLAHASVSFVASIANASISVETERKAAAQAERQRLVDATAALRAEIRELEWLLAQLQPDRERSDDLQDEYRQAQASTDKLRAELAELEHHIARHSRELDRLTKLENEVAKKRLSREELERESSELEQEIARLNELIASLQAKINRLDKYLETPSERIISSGTGRDAVYVECEGDGARIMPDDLRLSLAATPFDQIRLLELARQKGLVFFLIRPDGVQVFREYRRIVETASATEAGKTIDVGFEAVDADWQLSYEKVNDHFIITIE